MAGERILLVEDEALVAFALEAALLDAGYQVSYASDGTAALSNFEKDPGNFHCLITDIRMPGIDGWMVAKRVREVRPSLPVIYITGDSQAEWAAKGVLNSTVLTKPFRLDEAASGVAKALRGTQS